jgi:hypothetical protein
VIQSIRRGGAARQAHVFGLLVLIVIAWPVSATEPDGHLRLRTEWVQSASGRGPAIVRLSIHSLVPLDELTLTVSTPLELAVRPLTGSGGTEFRAGPAAPDRRAIRASLARFNTATPSTLDFELILSPGAHGILEFIVEGRDSGGKTVRNAIGVAAGEPPATGVHRLGAIEFPAVILPPTGKR